MKSFGLILLLTQIFIVVVLHFSPIPNPFSNFLSDLKFKFSSSQKPSGDVEIVAIDETSLKLGRWPWRRDYLALLTEKVFELGARNIGFDILFSEKQADQAKADQIFSQVLKKYSDRTTLARLLNESGQEIRTAALFSDGIANQGIVNAERDSDGVFRRTRYMFPNSNAVSLPLALIAQRLQTSPEKLVTVIESPINYLGPSETFKYHSAIEVLKSPSPTHGSGQLFKDKTILIGVTATGAGDTQVTPVDKLIAGVEIQANIAEQILHRRIPKEAKTETLILSLCLSALLILLGIKTTPRNFLLGWTSTVLLVCACDFYFFFPKGYFLATAPFYLSALSIALCSLGEKFYQEVRQKQFIRSAFSKYLSPEVIKILVSRPQALKLGGEKRELTTLFCDLRDFTTLSEKMEPSQLTALLTEIFTLLTAIVFKYNGTVDKYIGDALMAFFGAPLEQPDHALKACLAAKEMVEALKQRQPEFRHKYGVELSLGIGINTGITLVGNVGSEQRFNYSVLGDAVNIASRVESCNKEYGTNILITQNVLDSIQKMGFQPPVHRLVASPVLKGKSNPTTLFEI